MLGGDSTKDFPAVVVDGLSATVGLLGLFGDGRPATGESSGGIDDPASEGYGEHGVNILACGIRYQSPQMDATPTSCQETW